MSNKVLDACEDTGIPYPIVSLNRGVIVGGVLLALLFNQPLITAAVLLVLLPAALFGRKGSPIFKFGSWAFAQYIPDAPREDARVQRFNNIIAVTMLGAAQLAFALGISWLGWFFSVAVAFAALVALCGFAWVASCIFQFKINKFRVSQWLAR